MIYDERGEAIDYRFLDANPVFERQTGLADTTGRRVTEILPQTELVWLKTYEEVAQTGEPVRFEIYTEYNASWYQVYASRTGGADSRQVAVVFDDITERKRRERNLAFLADIEHQFASLATSEEIAKIAGASIGEHFDLSHCLLVDINEQMNVASVFHDHRATTKFPSLIGDYELANFHSAAEIQQLAAGHPVVVNDVFGERNPPESGANFDALGTRALLTAPYVRDGRWKFAIGAQINQPREWREDETEFLTELATRVALRLERARAEESLRKSEEKFRTFVNTTSDVVYRMSADWRTMRELDGKEFVFSTDTTSADWLESYIPENDRQAVRETIEKAIQTKSEFALEHRVNQLDGSIGWTFSRAVPILDEKGEIIEWLGTAANVTERKRAEEALRESHLRREFILDSSKIGEWELDLATGKAQHTFIHDQMFGAAEPLEEWSFEIFLSYIHPDDRDAVKRKFDESISEQKEWDFQCRVVRKDESVHWIHAKGNFYREDNEKSSLMIGIVTDITNQKEAEERLRVSRERFATLVENINDYAIFMLDAEGYITQWTEGAQRVKGYTAEEVIGEHLAMFYPPEAIAAKEPFVELAKAAKTGRSERESERVIKGGARIIVNEICTAIRDAAGNLVGFTKISRDITERKQAEEALRQSEETFSALVENAPFGVYLIDAEFRLRMTNEGSRKVFGGIEPLIGRDFAEILHILWQKPFAAETIKRFRHTLQTGESFISPPIVEQRANIEEIEAYDWQLHRVTLPDSSYGVVCYFYDLSEQKQMEAAVRESETRFRAIVNQATASIAEFDLDGNYTFVNQTLCDSLGYTEAELLQMNLREVTHPEDLPINLDAFEQALTTGKASINEKRVTRKNNSIIWITESISSIADAGGKPQRVAVITFDISRRKEIEEAFRTSSERLRLLVESASDYAIFTTTLDNRIDSWNAGAEKIFGWTEKEAVGQTNEIIFTPEDRQSGAAKLEMTTALAEGRAPDERFHIRKDGSRFYVSGVMNLLRDAEGNAHGFVKICRDMTERIEAEKAVRDKEMLQKLVGAQEDERKRIARDLHDELGQQLTALRMKLEATRKICEQEEICGKIDEIQLIAKQIDADVDFLAWELRPAALDDLGLIAALENYMREWSRHAGVTTEFHAPKSKKMRLAPEIEINLYRITQEALNNTHKHAEAKNVNVVLEERDDLIVLIVEDDGEGFNPNLKMNRSKGLGLMGMQERAALLKGTFEIESAPKQGTTVFIRVPALFVKKEEENV